MTTPTQPPGLTSYLYSPSVDSPVTDARSQAASSTSHLADLGSDIAEPGPERPSSQLQGAVLRPSIDTQSSAVRGLTGPVGEPGLPPSRQTSTRSSNRHAALPGSRRGPPSVKGSAMSVAGSDRRPPTAGSRTHVPLASHAFYRPMSSQRLQAQRGVRPSSLQSSAYGPAGSFTGGQTSYRDSMDRASNNPHRRSDLSNFTLREGQAVGGALDSPPLPPSRGTDYTVTEQVDRGTAHSVATGPAGTERSAVESVTPLSPQQQQQQQQRLQTPTQQKRPGRLDLDSALKHALPTPNKSPHSFRSSFILPSRSGRGSTSRPRMAVHEQGEGAHEKLNSTASSPRLGAMEPDIEQQKEVVKRQLQQGLGKNWEYWGGNTVFLWGGRLQNARDRPVNIMTGLLVVAPAGLFFGFSAPWIWHNIHPAVPIVFGYIFFVCFSSFFHGSVTDPGILPRNLHPFPPTPDDEDPLTLGPPTTEWTLVLSTLSASAAMEVPTKYCKSCNVWRPPRAHHCRVCDNCVETQDHHCVWLNNCIGRRNYRYFFTFISSCTLLAAYLFGAELAQLLVWMYSSKKPGPNAPGKTSEDPRTFIDAINVFRVSFAMLIYAVLGLPYPFALWLYHLFLTGRGETTREYLNSHKFLKKDRHRPFSQGAGIGGILKNWFAVLLRPRPPTYLRFKDAYQRGDQRFGERRSRRAKVPRKATEPEQPPAKGTGAASAGASGANGLEMREMRFQSPDRSGPAPA